MNNDKLFALIKVTSDFQGLPEQIIKTYMKEDGTEIQSAIRDCITDLLHYAGENKLSIKSIMDGALNVFKEEKWNKEQDMGCMIRVEVMEDRDIYLSKVTQDIQKIGDYLHFPMTDKGITDLKMELEDYGIRIEDLKGMEDELICAPLNERVKI
jgi:hypothetical protein